MKSTRLRWLATAGLCLATTAVAIGDSSATPILGRYLDDSRGDAIPDQILQHELGDVAFFPMSSAVVYHDHRYYGGNFVDDGIANDWTVHMTNVSGQAWKDLFFVADANATIGNADGTIDDLIGAPGIHTDAFHIDANGRNANLLEESILNDGIFQPGEDWEFAVLNFGTGLNSLPPALISPGQFAGSSQRVGFTGTNASILATPFVAAVPEPGTGMVLMMSAGAWMMRRRR